jgi:hypothetical protein
MPQLAQQVINGFNIFVPYVAYISACLSLMALSVVLYDRRPRLQLQAKKGNWVKVSSTLRPTPHGWVIEGLIEAYNVSSRANVIRQYELSAKGDDHTWVPLECEQYTLTESDAEAPKDAPPDTESTVNVTPLMVAPYSGVDVRVAGITPQMKKPEWVRVIVSDLFGKTYSLEVATRLDL